MKIKDCKIFLDNQWNSYYPGETINGSVEYILDNPIKVRGIKIKFHGGAKTSWYESSYGGKEADKVSPTSVNYLGDEEYFSTSYYLIGSKNGGELVIPEGKQIYQFTCALPPTLPSSFEGEFGYVRYTVKVTLDIPWKVDQNTKMAFNIVSHLDLNQNPDYKKPFLLHLDKTFCCCWCKSGPVIIDICMPITGFCSGQTMPLEISCENGSDILLNDIKLYFNKIIKYQAQCPLKSTKKKEVIIAQVDLGSLMGNSTRNWREVIEIPPLPPSNLANCKIIDLDYVIKIWCETSGARKNIDLKGNIILGTIPIVGYQSPQPTGNYLKNNQAGIPPNANSPWLSDPNVPGMELSNPTAPPYDGQQMLVESQFAAASIREDGDDKNMTIFGKDDFAPRYPTYRFATAPLE